MCDLKNIGLTTVMLIALTAGICPAEIVSSEPPAYLVVGGGVFNVLDHEKKAFGMAEWQPALRIGPLGTWVAFQTTDREHYLAAGLLYHWRIAARVFAVPSFGAGFYSEHQGLDLGYSVEFRSGVECGYDFKKAGRLSIGGWHISNGHLSDWNPGTELIAVRYAFPLSRP